MISKIAIDEYSKLPEMTIDDEVGRLYKGVISPSADYVRRILKRNDRVLVYLYRTITTPQNGGSFCIEKFYVYDPNRNPEDNWK